MDENEENQIVVLRKFKVLCSYFIGTLKNDNTLFLLKNLIKNNKKVLFEEDVCRGILDLIKLRMQEIEIDSIKASFIYDMIGHLCTYKGKAIRRN